jgi:Tol biopolymer transport system component
MLSLVALGCLVPLTAFAQKVDYSVVSVPEETGIDFQPMTTANDYVCMPQVKRLAKSLNWFTSRILDVSVDGKKLAYLSCRNNATNIFVKDLSQTAASSSVQRTSRQNIMDFSYSPDGKYICFSEVRAKNVQIFQTDASNGFVCRQITADGNDYSPIYSSDMSQIYFGRQESRGMGIWSYNVKSNYLSSVASGMSPCPIPNSTRVLCTRVGGSGYSEIWCVDLANGTEECILSAMDRSYASPVISPNGRWILLVGESLIFTGKSYYRNTDIYVCRTDGTQLTQLTFHAADDLSPVWSRDGRYIYFISQRGSADGVANVWRMPFTL